MEEQTTKPTNPALWIVFVIIILVLGVGAYFMFFQEEDTNTNSVVVTNATVNENTNTVANANTEIDTSDWKVYTNEKYGFSLKYPQDWKYLVRQDGSIAFAPNGNFGKFPEVSIHGMEKEFTSLAALKNMIKGYELINKQEEEMNINDLMVFKVSGTEIMPLTDGTYLFIERAVFEINDLIFEFNGNGASDIYDLMLNNIEI